MIYPRNTSLQKREASVGDVILSVNSPGYAVLMSIDRQKSKHGSSDYFIITYKRICDGNFNLFKNSKPVTAHMTYIPFKIEKENFKTLKETIATIESYIK